MSRDPIQSMISKDSILFLKSSTPYQCVQSMTPTKQYGCEDRENAEPLKCFLMWGLRSYQKIFRRLYSVCKQEGKLPEARNVPNKFYNRNITTGPGCRWGRKINNTMGCTHKVLQWHQKEGINFVYQGERWRWCREQSVEDDLNTCSEL